MHDAWTDGATAGDGPSERAESEAVSFVALIAHRYIRKVV
jgi:hypothetical protein